MKNVVIVNSTASQEFLVDKIVVSISLDVHNIRYSKTVVEIKEKVNIIKEELEKLGIQDMHITRTKIVTDGSKKEYDNEVSGFFGCHQMSFSFSCLKISVKEVAYKLGLLGIVEKMEIYLGVMDEEKINEKLINKSLENAKKEANAIANYSNMQIHEILSVDSCEVKDTSGNYVEIDLPFLISDYEHFDILDIRKTLLFEKEIKVTFSTVDNNKKRDEVLL